MNTLCDPLERFSSEILKIISFILDGISGPLTLNKILPIMNCVKNRYITLKRLVEKYLELTDPKARGFTCGVMVISTESKISDSE